MVMLKNVFLSLALCIDVFIGKIIWCLGFALKLFTWEKGKVGIDNDGPYINYVEAG